MSSLLSTFSCCFWWFLLGALLGWLLNKWLCRCTAKNVNTQVTHVATPTPVAAPAVLAPVVTAPKPVAAAQPVAAKVVSIDLSAAKAAGFTIRNANDLTVVEGIGPKINELLNNNGVVTFAQLADQSVAQLRTILDKGGSRFRIANPSTWAQQAAFAAANKWVELKKWQDELSGGVKK
jgi:predicted flap endonuclease-1-like 5' DNA nuclease